MPATADHFRFLQSPAAVAEQVFDAISKEQFYILTHPEFETAIRERLEDVLAGRVRPITIPT